MLLPVKFLGYQSAPARAILTMVLALALPIDKAKDMVKTLLSLGATSAQADIHGVTAFQRYAEENASELVELLWEMDKTGSRSALNHLGFTNVLLPQPAILLLSVGITNSKRCRHTGPRREVRSRGLLTMETQDLLFGFLTQELSLRLISIFG